MNETLAKLREQLGAIWQKTSSTQRLLVGFTAVLLVVVIGYGLFNASQPDYQPLWTNMDTSDAAAVQAKLQEMKVSFQLADGGKTILVPGNLVDSTRLSLVNANLPTGGVVGFELFDKTNFGETDTDRKAKYQRALQGELTRTIKGMEEVQNARVHIVIPETALFQEQQENATASIMLELKPYKKLSEDQIKGLVRLVSSSVQGLKPENVTIVDSNMANLTEDIALDNTKAAGSKLTASQLDLQGKVQKSLEKAAQSMLDQVMPGKAVVRVSAELNFDQIETNNEEFGNNVVRSQQVTDEQTTSQNSTAGGIPGTTSNVSTPTYQQVTPQTGSATSSKTNKITNYEVSKNQAHTVVAPGGIKKLSVAVLVNGGNISPTQKVALTDAVSNAVGIVQSRGDKVSVSAIPFDTNYYDQIKLQMEQEAKQQQYIIYGSIGAVLIALIVGLFLWWYSKRKEEELITPEGVVASDVLTVEELIHPEPEESPEDKEKEKVRQEIENLARQNPGNIAQLLKTWLTEE